MMSIFTYCIMLLWYNVYEIQDSPYPPIISLNSLRISEGIYERVEKNAKAEDIVVYKEMLDYIIVCKMKN